MTNPPRPPLDPDLAAPLASMPELAAALDLSTLEQIRAANFGPPIEQLIAGRGIVLSERVIAAADGAQLAITLFAMEGHTDASAPGIYHIHGGGMVTGNRFLGVDALLRWVEKYDAVGATIEYRLAPEHPDPTPVEDCYAGLLWFAQQHAELAFDPDRILITGGSAGGGLSAGTALLARDRKGPALRWQMLNCPMLDDRDRTVSANQIADGVPWARQSNRAGWRAYLGDRVATEKVSIYAAPARATDLTGLPPTFMDVGDAEVFRDEVVAYASELWRAGINCELHVWAGGFHGFPMFQSAAVSAASTTAADDWVDRQFSRLPR